MEMNFIEEDTSELFVGCHLCWLSERCRWLRWEKFVRGKILCHGCALCCNKNSAAQRHHRIALKTQHPQPNVTT